MLAVPGYSKADSSAAVFGSFTSETRAIALSKDVATQLNIPTRVVEVQLNNQRLFRVMSEPQSTTSARNIVRAAKKSGYSDAWLVRQAPPATHTVLGADVNPSASKPTDLPTAEETHADKRPAPVQLKLNQQAGHIARLDGANITIDGFVNEAAWEQIESFDQFTVLNPDTLQPARHQTQTRIFYDDSGLYVAALMDQPVETLVERLSARDEDINRDGFSLMLDTSGEGLYGYIFGLNLGGTKQDGKLAPESVMSYEWDGAWRGETQTLADGWSAELFIPWSILSMPESTHSAALRFLSREK